MEQQKKGRMAHSCLQDNDLLSRQNVESVQEVGDHISNFQSVSFIRDKPYMQADRIS